MSDSIVADLVRLSKGSSLVQHVSDSSRSKFQESTGTKHTLKFFLEADNAGICPFLLSAKFLKHESFINNFCYTVIV